VGANYRAACRSRSVSEFIAKIGIVIEEADESIYWMEIIVESGLIKHELVKNLIDEANEITAIMVATSKTSRNNNR
jgi:four helix bundle protein